MRRIVSAWVFAACFIAAGRLDAEPPKGATPEAERGPALASHEWIDIRGEYDEIVRVVTDGIPEPKKYKRAMPPKGGSKMSPDEIRSVAAYVWSTSHAPH